MYIRYPVRNFRCPSCGTRMPTEQFRAGRPWICPGCSQGWQTSKTHGSVVLLCFWLLAFLGLYVVGFRGWQLFLLAFIGGVVLTVILAGPLDRIIPPRLEAYEAPFWALPRIGRESVLGLSQDQNENGNSQNIERPDRPEPKPPTAR